MELKMKVKAIVSVLYEFDFESKSSNPVKIKKEIEDHWDNLVVTNKEEKYFYDVVVWFKVS